MAEAKTGLVKQIRRLVFSYDWEIVEVQGALFKIIWGIWLLLPFNTFQGLDVYSVLAGVMNETAWAVVLLFLGSLHFLTITTGSIKWRRVMIFVACMFWIFISIVFGLARIGSALIPITFVIAFFLAINYIRLGVPVVDKGRTDRV